MQLETISRVTAEYSKDVNMVSVGIISTKAEKTAILAFILTRSTGFLEITDREIPIQPYKVNRTKTTLTWTTG